MPGAPHSPSTRAGTTARPRSRRLPTGVGRRLVVGRRFRPHVAAVNPIRGWQLVATRHFSRRSRRGRDHSRDGAHVEESPCPRRLDRRAGRRRYRQRSSGRRALDLTTVAWSAPSLIGATPRGFPVGLQMRVEFGGTAAAVWGVSQGDGGPFLNKTDAAGAWQAAIHARSRHHRHRPRRRAVLAKRPRHHLVPDRRGRRGRCRRAQAPLTRRDDWKPSFRTPSPAGPRLPARALASACERFQHSGRAAPRRGRTRGRRPPLARLRRPQCALLAALRDGRHRVGSR